MKLCFSRANKQTTARYNVTDSTCEIHTLVDIKVKLLTDDSIWYFK